MMQEEKVSSGRMDPQSQMLTSWEKERIHRKALEPLSEEGAGAQKTAVGLLHLLGTEHMLQSIIVTKSICSSYCRPGEFRGIIKIPPMEKLGKGWEQRFHRRENSNDSST